MNIVNELTRNGKQNGENGFSASSLKTPKGNKKAESKALYLYGCKTPQQKSEHKKIFEKRQTQTTLVNLLKRIHENELADKFSQCSQNFSFKTCGEHILDPIADFRCEQYKLCPFCARRRANRLCNKYLPLATLFVRRSMEFTGQKVTPCHLVLTQQQIKGETATKARERLYKSIIKLTRRSFFKSNFKGGLGSFEVTVSKKSGLWHYHCHLTVFRVGYWGKETGKLEELKRIWAECSPQAENLYLGVIDNVNRGLSETIKYGMKPADIENLSGEQLKQLLKLKGKKMTFPFGDFKKFCSKYQLTTDEKAEFAKEKNDYIQRDENGEAIGYKPCHCGKALKDKKLSTNDLIQFVRNIEAIPKARAKPIERYPTQEEKPFDISDYYEFFGITA